MGQTYPMPLPPGATTPEYLGDVTYDWPYNGLVGNDVNVATANATGYYEPKNQGNKASMLGLPLAVDITTPSGWIDPLEPYEPPPVPTLTSLDPPSRPAASLDDVTIKLIGTNFMPSSQMTWGGTPDRATYVSPTELQTIVRGGATGPHTSEVRVINGGVSSDAVNFEYT